MCEEDSTIILDIGSGMTKVGYSLHSDPSHIFPTVIGSPKYSRYCNDKYIGDDASSRAGVLRLKYPVERGIFTDASGIEDIIRYSFEKIKASPSEHFLLFADSIVNKDFREKVMEIMFETYDIPKYCTASQTYLSLYSNFSSETGIVVESGYGITQIAAYDDGKYIKGSSKILNFGGKDLSRWLNAMLQCRGYDFYQYFINPELEIIKKTKTFVNEKKNINNISESLYYSEIWYDTVTIKEEANYCPEPFFNQSAVDEFLEKYYSGSHKAFYKGYNNLYFDKSFTTLQNEIYDIIMHIDPDIKYKLLKNIIICGGNTMFDGFKDRLLNELTNLIGPFRDINVRCISDPRYSAWCGGSIIESFKKDDPRIVITRNEYNDVGKRIVNSKFIL